MSAVVNMDYTEITNSISINNGNFFSQLHFILIIHIQKTASPSVVLMTICDTVGPLKKGGNFCNYNAQRCSGDRMLSTHCFEVFMNVKMKIKLFSSCTDFFVILYFLMIS